MWTIARVNTDTRCGLKHSVSVLRCFAGFSSCAGWKGVDSMKHQQTNQPADLGGNRIDTLIPSFLSRNRTIRYHRAARVKETPCIRETRQRERDKCQRGD